MKLMRQVLARLAPCRASAMLWSAGCVAVLLTACATHTEPLIHRVQVEVTREAPVNATRVAATEVEVTSQAPVEVIREVPVEVIREVPVEVTRVVPREVEVTREVRAEVPVEVTRVVSREVEVTREIPVEATRIVEREVEVTRVVPREVVKEVVREVVVTATPKAQSTRISFDLEWDEVPTGVPLTIFAEGFEPFTTVDYLTIGDVKLGLRPVGRTDAEGNFATVVRVPPLAPGVYRVRLVVGDSAATGELGIIAGPYRRDLTLFPPEGSPGDMVTLKGRGFSPYGHMQYLLLDELNITPSPNPLTNQDGEFEARVIIPSLERGTHEIRVLVGDEFAMTTLEILP